MSRRPSEPTVPLSVHERACDSYERQIERLLATIEKMTAPAAVLERKFEGPAWVTEAEQDLEHAKRVGLDDETIKALQAEVDFNRPIAEQFD